MAPHEISYLSVDTEVSEYEILKAFNFNRYRFSFISAEHHFTNQKSAIFDLLIGHGYKRFLPEFFEWNDWYIRICLETEDFTEKIDE